MGRKKLSARYKLKSSKKNKSEFFSQIKWGESYTSLLLGLIAVLVIGVIVFSFAKGRMIKDTSSTNTSGVEQMRQAQDQNSDSQKTYTVEKGDNLWKISEKIYKSGYNWVDIAKANNLENPGMIFSGNKLMIPGVQVKIVTKSTAGSEIKVSSIVGDSYVVVAGDNVWNIAVRAYGDGFRYIDIVKANSLENPSLIFSGNILKIPR